MWDTLNCLPDAVEHMIHGDPDEPDSVKASDAVKWAIAEIARLREERRWVPVGERLPEEGVEVLWWCNSYDEDRGVFVGKRDRSLIVLGSHTRFIDPDFTHWQPLPPGPEGDG
jgi:hypothetical protein